MNQDSDILDSSEMDQEVFVPEMDESRLLQTIWFQPRNTLLYIAHRVRDKYVMALLIIGGAVSGMHNVINRSSSFGSYDSTSIFKLIIALVLGALLGPLLNMIFATILAWFGRVIGGVGKYKEVLAAIAWSMVPSIAAVAVTVFSIGFFGLEGLMGGRILSNHESIVLIVASVLKIVLGIWSIVLLINGLSVAHQFSIGKAILNLFLPILAILIPIAAIAFILGDLFNNF